MIHKSLEVSIGEKPYAIVNTYFLDNYRDIDKDRKRPVIIICPGGGYEFISDREAEAVAIRYNAMGFHACILRYAVVPAEFPQALMQLAYTVSYLREHKEEYGIREDKIIVSGFSAGGHLAASLGVFWDKKWLAECMHMDNSCFQPNGLLLAYPVISSGQIGHVVSFKNLLGKQISDEMLEKLSIEKQVTNQVPPVFIWHTWEDDTVPVQNSLLFAQALKQAGVTTELHIYPKGGHGLSLANEETKSKGCEQGVEECCQSWITLAQEWMKEVILK